MHRITPSEDMAAEVTSKLFELRYRREFHLSSVEYENEPEEALAFMQMVYSLEADRAKLEKEMQEHQRQ